MKNNKGITLISLVVTIIVLIILAGISISLVLGENGIITKAKEAKNNQIKEQEKEAVSLAVTASQMYNDSLLQIKKDNLEKELKNQLGNDANVSVIENGSNNLIVKFNDVGRIYYVESTGKIIDSDNILEITTAEELKAFRDEVNNGNTFEGEVVFLANDITLDVNEEWEPIGTYLNTNTSVSDETNITFEGIFDGAGHTIDGLKITSKEKGKGLFGLTSKAKIKNLTIGENCNIDAGVSFGSISGYINNGTIIENCFNKANVISNSMNIGGIVGTSGTDCIIKYCGNLDNVQGQNSVGGIVGSISGSKILNCYNIANITSETTNVGGIVGAIYIDGKESSINNCYNLGDIIGTGNNIGGVVGILDNKNTTISNTYSVGNITGKRGGGIVGAYINGTIKNSYYLENTINGTNGTVEIGTFVKTDEEMKNIHKLLGNEFKANTNNGYPILSWQ